MQIVVNTVIIRLKNEHNLRIVCNPIHGEQKSVKKELLSKWYVSTVLCAVSFTTFLSQLENHFQICHNSDGEDSWIKKERGGEGQTARNKESVFNNN